MNAPATFTPKRRSQFRKALNGAWLLILLILGGEFAFLLIAGSAKAGHDDSGMQQVTWGRGGQTGVALYGLVDGRLTYAVLCGLAPTGRVDRVTHLPWVGSDRPFSTGRVWLNLSRAEREQINLDPPRIFFCLGDQATNAPLPAGFTLSKFMEFINSPESVEGVKGFQQWLSRQAK